MTRETDPLLTGLASLQRQDQRIPASNTQAQAEIDAAGELPLSAAEIQSLVQHMMQPDPPATRPVPEASYGQAQDAQGRAPVDPGQRRTRRVIMRAAMATAAGLAVGVAVWLGVMGHSGTVYAQVIAALDEARSMHAIGYQRKDGQWVKDKEAWYDKQRGVRESTWRDGQMREARLDDGRNEWHYVAATRTVVRYGSSDPIGVIRELLSVQVGLPAWQHDSAGDQTLAGVPTRMYVQTKPEGKEQVRVWVDAGMHILQGQGGEMKNGCFEPSKMATVEYDVQIDPTKFSPDFGPDVRMIDGQDVRDAIYGLQNAVFKKEILGLVVSVHQVKRVEGDGVLVTYSVRPTEATIREFGTPADRKNNQSFGYVRLDDVFYKPLPDTNGKHEKQDYLGIDLAEVHQDDVLISWHLMLPRNQWPKMSEQLELCAKVYTANELGRKWQRQGDPGWQEFQPLVVLPLPPQPLSLHQVTSETLADVRRLAPVVENVTVVNGAERIPDNGGSVSIHSAKPDSISDEEYFEGVQQIRAALEDMLKSAQERTNQQIKAAVRARQTSKEAVQQSAQ